MNYDPETETRIAKWREFVSPLMDKIASEQRLVAELRKTEVIQSATIRELRAHVEALRAALSKIADRWPSTSNPNCEDYERGYGQAVAELAFIARAALRAARQPPEGQKS